MTTTTRPPGGAVYLRLGAALLALAAGTVAVLVAAELLSTTPGPAPLPASTSPAAGAAPAATPSPAQPSSSGFPAPPPGSVVFAQEVGSDAVALAVVPGSPLRLQASVVGPDGSGVGGLRVAFLAGGRRIAATACGAGCYRASVDAAAPGPSVAVSLPRSTVRFALPAAWPPADGTAIVARAGRVWRGLETLVSHERLGSSPTAVLHTVYRFQAPSSLSYTIRGGSAAVIVGGTRWDRPAPGARWRRSPQSPELRQPQPFWASATDAHVVGSGRLRGRAIQRVSFFDPSSSAWFLAAIDRRTGHTLDLRMTAASHFMHDVYGPFDVPFRITPPGGSR